MRPSGPRDDVVHLRKIDPKLLGQRAGGCSLGDALAYLYRLSFGKFGKMVFLADNQRPVTPRVFCVFLWGRPAQIADRIVGWFAVPVRAIVSLGGRRPNEMLEHKSMDGMSLRAILVVKGDAEVATMASLGL